MAAISSFNPEYVIKNILTPLIDMCLDKTLHVRHGAIMGVSEILIGLSGNSFINKRETLDKAIKSLSLKEIQLIADSDYRNKFAEMYNIISTKNYLGEVIPEASTSR